MLLSAHHAPKSPLATLREVVRNQPIALHGSNRVGLQTLHPNRCQTLHIYDPTQEVVAADERIFCTTFPELAIFHAAVRAVCRDAGLQRATGITALYDSQGNVTRHDYFMSARAKQFVTTYELTRSQSIVYHVPKNELSYDRSEGVWFTSDQLQVIGWVAVSSQDLPFDIDSLAPPDSVDRIHDYYEQHGTPPETPPISSQ